MTKTFCSYCGYQHEDYSVCIEKQAPAEPQGDAQELPVCGCDNERCYGPITGYRCAAEERFDRHSKEPAFNEWYENYAHWDSTEEAYKAWQAAEQRATKAALEAAAVIAESNASKPGDMIPTEGDLRSFVAGMNESMRRISKVIRALSVPAETPNEEERS